MPRQQLIKIRTGATTPAAGDFQVSEPAWDASNKRFYIKAADNSMAEVGGVTNLYGANQADYGLLTEGINSTANYGTLT
jgi:hypothetical protein